MPNDKTAPHWGDMGWNDDTERKLTKRFITSKGLDDELDEYLQGIADDENEEAMGGEDVAD